MSPLISSSRRAFLVASVLVVSIAAASPAAATVLTGPLTDVPESSQYCWGAGVQLCQSWSLRSSDSGWFYGIGAYSNASIYIAHGLGDPTTVTNAETFTYSDSPDYAEEGDTVFFRSADGYYGAWKVTNIDPLPGPDPPLAELTGQWYYQTNQTGCFAANCGPLPTESKTWGSIKALYR